MDIREEKIEIVKLILETENQNILKSVKKLLSNSSDVDFWNSLSQKQKEEIASGIDDIDNGRVQAYDDIMKKHR